MYGGFDLVLIPNTKTHTLTQSHIHHSESHTLGSDTHYTLPLHTTGPRGWQDEGFISCIFIISVINMTVFVLWKIFL